MTQTSALPRSAPAIPDPMKASVNFTHILLPSPWGGGALQPAQGAAPTLSDDVEGRVTGLPWRALDPRHACSDRCPVPHATRSSRRTAYQATRAGTVILDRPGS